MIQLVPQIKVLLAVEPVDFRKGIDTLAAVCKEGLLQDPLSGALFVFRNRSGTALDLQMIVSRLATPVQGERITHLLQWRKMRCSIS